MKRIPVGTTDVWKFEIARRKDKSLSLVCTGTSTNVGDITGQEFWYDGFTYIIDAREVGGKMIREINGFKSKSQTVWELNSANNDSDKGWPNVWRPVKKGVVVTLQKSIIDQVSAIYDTHSKTISIHLSNTEDITQKKIRTIIRALFRAEFDMLKDICLHTAVSMSKIKTIKRIIADGTDVNAINNHGYTPLHSAVLFNKNEIVKILIDAGADPNIKTCKPTI